MGVRRQVLFWTGLFLGVILLLWLLSDVLLPFVIGVAVAYFIDPIVTEMERRGMARGTAAGVLVVGTYLVGIGLTLVLAPILFEQVAALARTVPAQLTALYERVTPLLARAGVRAALPPPAEVTERAVAALESLTPALLTLAGGVLNRGLAFLNLVGLLAVTPLVAFYLLRDWPRIVAEVDGWLPRPHAETIREQAHAIDDVLAGFVRGTALVCFFLGAFYALALTLVGLELGLVIGLAAGAVSFIPYLGTAFGLVASVGVALYQFWPALVRPFLVFGIFAAGQVLADYVLTPRLVGERIGLHPLWVMFAVFAGGALFGFVGILVAVPACAAIGVLVRFGVRRYKASPLYRGPGGDGPASLAPSLDA